MSKAYRCDRCGCYFDSKKTVYSGGIDVIADLCHECIGSFEKWVRMKDGSKSDGKLDGDPIDIDKAVEHYEGTLEVLKGIDLEDKA